MTIKDKALFVIENIAVGDNKPLTAKKSDLIFRMAHCVRKSTCHHPDWIKECEDIYEQIKDY